MSFSFPRLSHLRYPFIALLLILGVLWLHKGFYVKEPTMAAHQDTHTVMITPVGFLPKQISYQKGEHITLRIVNIDKRTHNFVIEALQVRSANLEPNESTTLSFNADKQGGFLYVSNTPGFSELNYEGMLRVE